MLRKQVLVSGHHRLARFQGGANQLQRLVRPPDDLDDDINLGSANYFSPIGKQACAVRNVLRFNPRAPAYGGDLEPNVASPLNQAGVLREDARRGAANRAKANDTDAHCFHVQVEDLASAAGIQDATTA